MKNIAILIGSFTNPAAAKDMLKSEGSEFQSSDEDFESTLRMIEEDVENENNLKRRKRQRKLAESALNGRRV